MLHGGNLALRADVLRVKQVQLQSYYVVRCGTIGAGKPGCTENCSLATDGDLRAYTKPILQRSFHGCGRKLYWHNVVSDTAGSHFLSTELGRDFALDYNAFCWIGDC